MTSDAMAVPDEFHRLKPAPVADYAARGIPISVAATGFSNQKPISRYDVRPTSSQKKKVCKRFDASTRPVIEKEKKLKKAK